MMNQADLADLNAASRRIERAGGALSWLASGWRLDVDALREPTLLDLSYEVLAFAGAWSAGALLARPPLDRELMKQLFRETRSGVVGACQIPPQTWEAFERARARITVEFARDVPDVADSRLAKRKPPKLGREARRNFHDTETDRIWWPMRRVHRIERPTLEDLFLLRAAREIEEGQARIRRCWQCKEPFVRVRKQRYCGPSCAQRVRDQRRRPTVLTPDTGALTITGKAPRR